MLVDFARVALPNDFASEFDRMAPKRGEKGVEDVTDLKELLTRLASGFSASGVGRPRLRA